MPKEKKKLFIVSHYSDGIFHADHYFYDCYTTISMPNCTFSFLSLEQNYRITRFNVRTMFSARISRSGMHHLRSEIAVRCDVSGWIYQCKKQTNSKKGGERRERELFIFVCNLIFQNLPIETLNHHIIWALCELLYCFICYFSNILAIDWQIVWNRNELMLCQQK